MTGRRSIRPARMIAATALSVTAGCAGMHAGPAHPPAAQPAHGAADSRQPLALTPAERDAVLAEMRQMLGSVSGVLHGLAANDRQAIAGGHQQAHLGSPLVRGAAATRQSAWPAASAAGIRARTRLTRQ